MKKTIWIVIGVIVLAGLGWWLFTMQSAQAPTGDTGQVQGASDQFTDNSKDGAADGSTGVSAGVTVGAGQPVSAYTVKYTDNGFEPSTLSVPVGTQVTFVNQSSHGMWIGSDNHPSHTLYDGTSRSDHCAPGYTGAKPFDECGTGSSFTFTFTKAGSFSYHNHVSSNDTGTIVVK